MKLKTFLATYLLFLVVLFSCFAIVSAFMINSQINMYMERSAAEYQRIASSLARDISILHGMSQNFIDDLYALLDSYMAHYAEANVLIGLHLMPADSPPIDTFVSFLRHSEGYFIRAIGSLPQPFHTFRLDYLLDITSSMVAMNRIQNVLLAVCVGFAALTALILYLILTHIFKRLVLAQSLKDAAEAKQRFVDNIAHELRTPLTSIFGYAEYVQKIAADNAETIESMQYIMDEAGHMQNISNSLLSLATLRGYVAAKEPIAITPLFDDIRQSLSTHPNFANIQFITKIETETIHGQEDLFKSLLINLCTNALKACPAEGGVVTLAAREGMLSVTDNGCGIEPESLPKITQPFYRVDKARSRDMGGAGLGLALCARIAEVHGATLLVESTVGIGTKVEISFYNSAITLQ
ncbi:MAG: HAMP domain-containing histidine kinase [Defluviitaleaceae bacterium]|nr:HAMP domain-containing histidine kinase [Defluviitaleaceae bacterium]